MLTQFYLQLNEVLSSAIIFTTSTLKSTIFLLVIFQQAADCFLTADWCVSPMTHDPSVITMTHHDSLTQIEIHINISIIRQWYFSHDWFESVQPWRQITWYTTWMMFTRCRSRVGVFICYRTFLTFLSPWALFMFA